MAETFTEEICCGVARASTESERLEILRMVEEQDRLLLLINDDMVRVLFEYMGEFPKEIPLHVDRLIAAYCADYERRAEAIANNEAQKALPKQMCVHRRREGAGKDGAKKLKGRIYRGSGTLKGEQNGNMHLSYAFRRRRTLPATLIAHYKDVNLRIDTALSFTVGFGKYAETFRREIGDRTGHRKTALYYLDPKTYIIEKKRAKLAIAAALGIL